MLRNRVGRDTTNADGNMSSWSFFYTHARKDAGGRAVRFFITLILTGALFLGRFGCAVGDSKLPLTLVVTTVAIAQLAVFGHIRVHLARLALFSATLAAMLFAAMAGGSGRVSVNSFLLLVVVYTPYIFILSARKPGFAWCIASFRTLSTVIAVAGILQFFGQLIIPGWTLFTFADYFPSRYLIESFNYVIPVPGMPSMNKSNDFSCLNHRVFRR